jgi:hypothetical protein
VSFPDNQTAVPLQMSGQVSVGAQSAAIFPGLPKVMAKSRDSCHSC